MPHGVKELLEAHKHVLVPELNRGQLSMLLRARFLVDAKPLSKMKGLPFEVAEIMAAAEQTLESGDR
jgi:2-oxoglutarate ferredoxin oxidoreductase subunit alpha